LQQLVANLEDDRKLALYRAQVAVKDFVWLETELIWAQGRLAVLEAQRQGGPSRGDQAPEPDGITTLIAQT
jgi:hypothetical protein